jgi:hypothetical protein
VTVYVLVPLEPAVVHALSNVATANRTDIPGLLAAAGRHVARTQGGLREPVYRLRSRDPVLPDDDVDPDAPKLPKPRNVAAPGSAWSRPNAVGRRKGERFAPAVKAAQDDVVRMYRDELLPMRSIAEALGFSPTTVRALLVDARVAIRPKGWVTGRTALDAQLEAAPA